MQGMTPHEFISALGESAVSAATGAKISTVRKQRYRERMPSGWWVACCALCEARGMPEPPPALFGMVGVTGPSEAAE